MKVFQTFSDKRNQAIKKLVELGIMKYAKDVEVYHGRAGNGKGWEVNPNFNNAGNSTGNYNVCKVSALYTSSLDVAKRFASARKTINNPQVETYKILPKSQDFVVFDRTFNINKLNSDQQTEFYNAMSILTNIPLLQMVPIKFEYRSAYPYIHQEIQRKYSQLKYGIFMDEDIDEVCNELINNPNVMQIFKNKSDLIECVTGLLSASNSKRLMRLIPNMQLRNALGGCDKLQIKTPDGENHFVKTNAQYIMSLCEKNGIIGAKEYVDSATLGETIEVVEYFNLKSIATEQQLNNITNYNNSIFGEIAPKVVNVIEDNQVSKFFQCASASEIMQFVCQNEKLDEAFSKSAGVWEGYTVGQHTEAVLNFLYEYKVSEIPSEVLPLIKIAILAHDIGKGYAVDSTSRWYGMHKQANQAVAHDLYKEMGIDAKYIKLLDFMFTEAQDFTSQYYFGNSEGFVNPQQKEGINQNMQQACKNVLEQTFNTSPSMSEIRALQKLCIVLQQCDSGAYTRYSTINGGNKLFYLGGSDKFTRSFIIGNNGSPRLKTYHDEQNLTQ